MRENSSESRGDGNGPGALDGMRVLEIGEGISAPFATRLLADLGADVVKVESPDGDPVRRWGPSLGTSADPDRRALFEFLNWNKRSVSLDVGADRRRLLRLVDGAHVVVVGDDASLLERWGLDVEGVRARRDDLVVVTVTPFGIDGPYRDWRGTDLVVQAMSGLMAISGTSDREPLKRGLRQTSYTAGLNAAYAGLAAYYAATRHGVGTHIDVAVLEAVSAELILNAPTYSFMGAIQGRRPRSKDPFSGEPVPVKDGYGSVQTNSWTTLSMFADLLDEPRLAEERFNAQPKRVANAVDLTAILVEALRDWTGRDLLTRAAEAGLLTGCAQSAEDLLTCPQLQARGTFHEIPDSSGARGRWRFPAQLARLGDTPSRIRRYAPGLGEHQETEWSSLPEPVLPSLPEPVPPGLPERVLPGLPEATTAGAADAATTHSPDAYPVNPYLGFVERPGPLKGLKVIDLSSVVAAPLIGGMLRDLGADVIKVEAPSRLDQSRGEQFGPLFNNDPLGEGWNRSGAFQSLNRGKKSISIDLKQERGRALLRRLVASADVLLENFTPRVMRSWGMTYEELAELNPRLVMLSNTGYGSTGPWRSYKAQGTTLELTMGVGSYSGYENDKPTKIGQSYPDFIAAWAGLTAVFAALVHRDRTGRGQWIDCGMYELGSSLIPEAFIAVQSGGQDHGRQGNADLDSILSAVVPGAGLDRWLALSVPDRVTWDRLAGTVPGVPAAPADGTDPDDEQRTVALQAVRRWSAALAPGAAAEALQRAGVPAGPVNDARDLVLDRHFAARGFYERLDYGGDVGPVRILSRGFRWRGNHWYVGVRGPGPGFAAHNDEVLAELGLDEGQRQALRDDRVIVDSPVSPPPLRPVDLAATVRNGLYREIDPHFRDVVARGIALACASPPADKSGASR